MAKILLYTIHDYACSGIRSLGAYTRMKGHDTRLLFLGSIHGMRVLTSLNYNTIQELNQECNDPTFIIHSQGEINLPDKCLNFNIPETFLNFLADWKPDIIGFSCRSILTPYFQDWFYSIRKASPSSLIAAGGFGPTLEPEIYLDRGADCVIRGEGEEALTELAECLDKKQPFFGVKNLVFRKNKKTIIMPLRPAIQNLDILPPQLKLCKGIYVIQNDNLIEHDPLPRYAINRCFLSRGCVGSCNYCSAGHWNDSYKEDKVSIPKYRYPSNDVCLKTFMELKGKGAKAIGMEDDFFIRPYKMIKDFFDRYKREIGIPFYAYLHPHFIYNHPDILNIALNAGMGFVNLPIQSADIHINKHLFNRNTDLKTVLDCAFFANSRFIPFVTHFIDGFFAENIDMEMYLEKNLDFIKKLPPFHPGFPKLIQYSISYLRLYLNSPLLRAKKTKKMPYSDFFYRGMLMLFRHILNDDEFEALKCNTVYKKSPEPLLDLFNQARSIRHNEYMVSMARRFAGRNILIWGCGNIYHDRKPLFVGLKPQAFVTDIPVPERNVDGIPVLKLQDVINNKQNDNYIPIFICVQNAQARARKLKEICPDYPEEYIIGFGEN